MYEKLQLSLGFEYLLTISDMKNFLADVRQSMLSCRRTQAIPQDFLQALHTHQLSLRSLIVHLDPPVPPSRSQFALESDDTKIEEGIDSPLLAKILGKNQDKQSYSFVPRHFPDFPSKHAYKETPHFPEVERDPRRIRERVIEESRLGEEALRKLFNATSDQFSATQSKSSHGAENVRSKGENLWQEAMLAMAPECEKEPTIGSIDMDHDAIQYGHTSNGISLGKWHVSSAVNADRKYWRKSAAALKRENVQKNGFI